MNKPLSKMTPYYTSEAQIRQMAESQFKNPTYRSSVSLLSLGIKKDQELGGLSTKQKLKLKEEWIERLVNHNKMQKTLLTDQQFADWQLGRTLRPGDKARYVGETRTEQTDSGDVVERANGQLGVIIQGVDETTLRFIPSEPVNGHTVILEIGAGPAGSVERVPELGEKHE